MFRRDTLTLTVLLITACVIDGALAADSTSGALPRAQGHTREKVDKLFEAWSQTLGTPGCELGVLRDGKIIYSRGYGLADLEHDAPMTPDTPIHVASVSKQFTAMAIHLLAQDGKLSLEDDIHKYLPELHDFGKPITIRQLLHHMSGLRDQMDLLALAGWRFDDVITEQDILDLVWRENALNFAPGEEQSYSNTGYTLLGVIVKRVSGKTLQEFANERIFRPLGMRHTRFHDQYGDLVRGRAYSYAPNPPHGFRAVAVNYSYVGSSSLFTTVDDLALWDENFYTGRVGGKDLLGQMQMPGVLNNGMPTQYASGLIVQKYRNLNMVEHGGEDAGFRAVITRFPDQHFSAIVLCNNADAQPDRIAHSIADIYLVGEFAASPPSKEPVKPPEFRIDPKLLDSYVGDYVLMPNYILTIMRNGDQLMGQVGEQSSFDLTPASSTSFFPTYFDAILTFDTPGAGGYSAHVRVHQGGFDRTGPRLERPRPTAERLRAYSGTYFSTELNTLYFITVRDGKLLLHYRRGELELQPFQADVFDAPAPAPLHRVTFECAAVSRCEHLRISTARVRNLRFDRVEVGN
jgi:CubicO group peptidase (beta-lactamase class C family)